MPSLNKVILIGHLGKDPETRYVSNGNPVCNFSLATGESYKDKAGTKHEKTVWHNIVVWGKLAEVCQQYLKKGASVYLEGKIDNRTYDDRDGNKRYVSEVIIDAFGGKMIMLGGRGNSGSPSGEESQVPPSDSDLPF